MADGEPPFAPPPDRPTLDYRGPAAESPEEDEERRRRRMWLLEVLDVALALAVVGVVFTIALLVALWLSSFA